MLLSGESRIGRKDMSRALARRLSKLEAIRKPSGPPRLVVRYEGGSGKDPEEPEADIDESDPNAVVVVVQYVDMSSKAPLGHRRDKADR
jgi:hypothetical protein